MSLPDLDQVDAILREVATTIILPYFRSLATAGIRQKTGPNDLVTKADLEAEAALTPRLSALVPGSLVVGEEAASADPAVLERLSGEAPVWIIDPVDGTINFANGRPDFAVIVAYAVGGRTRAGWIHDPLGDRTAMAADGQGCWLKGERVRFAPVGPEAPLRGALSTRFCDAPTGRRLDERRPQLGPSGCLASAAHEYLALLDGSSQYSLYHRLMPWDHAAGALLVSEAGGRSALVDGTPYGPTVLDGTLLNAPDPATWERVRAFLYE